MWPVRASSLAGSLSTQRSYVFSRGTVADVAAAVRKAFGGMFNDVILAAVTSGFRTLLAARGEDRTRTRSARSSRSRSGCPGPRACRTTACR